MNRIALKGGLLIDGTGAAAVKDSLVLVDNGKITYAGPGKAVPKGYHITDISGKTVMPGLIDAHLHFSGNLTDNDSDWVLEDNIQKAVVAVQQSHECLETRSDDRGGNLKIRHPYPEYDRGGCHEGAESSGLRPWVLRHMQPRGFS